MIKTFNIACSLLSFLFIITSCNEDPYQMGLDLLPSDDNFIIKIDSGANTTEGTILKDSLLSHALVLTNSGYRENDTIQLMGDYNDQVFGRKTSHLLYQVYPTFVDSIPHDISADSLILYLQVDSVLLGNRNEQQELEIYSLNKLISADTAYYTNTDYSDYKGELLCTWNYTPNTKVIRIPINNTALLKKLYDLDSLQNISSNFKDQFKGFYLISKNKPGNKGVLMSMATYYYKSNVSQSKLALYYTTNISYTKGTVWKGNTITVGSNTIDYGDTLKSDITVPETRYKTYKASGYVNGASSITNDFTNSEVASNADYFYIQGAAGPFGKITMYDLYDKWRNIQGTNESIAFNKVELEMTPAYDYLNSVGISAKDYPNNLELYYERDIHHDKSDYGIDTTITYAYSIIGTYDKVVKKYIFNMTPLMQHIIKERDASLIPKWNHLDLYIKDSNGLHSGGRIAFKKQNFLRVKVIYTLIK